MITRPYSAAMVMVGPVERSMNSQNAQPLQATFMSLENVPQADVLELPPDFKVNGFWQVDGQNRAGTLRANGLGSLSAYFIVSHKAGQPPFIEPTEVTFESRDGQKITGRVLNHSHSKDAGGQAVCSEYSPSGERCQKTRFWQTYCKEHARAKGIDITDDGRICMGQKQDGGPCRNKAKVSGLCAQHGGGSAPREITTRLYEFPISIIDITGGSL